MKARLRRAGQLAGCGGWSRRATLYGGDQSPGRNAALLDPASDAARSEGFTNIELMATLAGEPLYRACGYELRERVTDDRGGAAVPLLRMSKPL
jgi:hypothetical protein